MAYVIALFITILIFISFSFCFVLRLYKKQIYEIKKVQTMINLINKSRQ